MYYFLFLVIALNGIISRLGCCESINIHLQQIQWLQSVRERVLMSVSAIIGSSQIQDRPTVIGSICCGIG